MTKTKANINPVVKIQETEVSTIIAKLFIEWKIKGAEEYFEFICNSSKSSSKIPWVMGELLCKYRGSLIGQKEDIDNGDDGGDDGRSLLYASNKN